MHVGKEGYPTRSWDVAVDHTRWINFVQPSEPGARNDKTNVRVILIKLIKMLKCVPKYEKVSDC